MAYKGLETVVLDSTVVMKERHDDTNNNGKKGRIRIHFKSN